ncbi:MAG: hypothetical protein GX633_01440 [Clostridiales bacterium]|nr:hypothetical protein [Clostridiales bacterium]
MTKCTYFAGLINGHIDGILTDNEKNELIAHLAECEECHTRLEMMTLLSEEMSLMVEEVPDGFTEAVMKSVRNQSGNRIVSIFTSRKFVAAVAVIAFLAVSVATISRLRPKLDEVIAMGTEKEDVVVYSAAAPQFQEELTAEDSDKDEIVNTVEEEEMKAAPKTKAMASAAKRSAKPETVTKESVSLKDGTAEEPLKLNQVYIMPEDINGTYGFIVVISGAAPELFTELEEVVTASKIYSAYRATNEEYEKLVSSLGEVDISSYPGDSSSDDVLILVVKE